MAFSSRPRSRLQKAYCSTDDNLGHRVVHGAVATFLGIAFRTTITIGSMAALARLLTPADFGQLTMAIVIADLAAVFSNFGFGSILIQRVRISRIQIDTMFWCAVGLGVLLTSIVFAISFFAGYFYQDDMVGPLLRVLCVSFILEELAMVPSSLLARRMQFKLILYIQIGMLLVRAGTAIILALNGMGVWSLVGGSLAGWLVQSCAYQVLAGYWPRARFSASFLKSTWRTNGSYFGNGILFYVNTNLDLMLIGRMLGPALLGQYQNARSLTDEIRVRMVQPLQRVLFPAFSTLQNDPDRFRDAISRSCRLLALLFMPVGFGLAAVAPELVPVLYGNQWLPMVPILQVISISSGIGALAAIGSPIFNATNRVGMLFRLYSYQTLLSVIFLIIGSHWGLMGFAWSRLAFSIVSLFFFRIALGLVGMQTRHLLKIIGPPLVAAGFMWFLLGMAREWGLMLSGNNAVQLGVLILLGVICYITTSLIISRAHVRDALEVFRKLRGTK